jgi:hypothetical protein
MNFAPLLHTVPASAVQRARTRFRILIADAPCPRLACWNKQSKKISLYQAQQSLTMPLLKNIRITSAFFSLPATAVRLALFPNNWQAIEKTSL